ncbi:hypothetical protein Adt_46939 [Abeliophyllum distichum]|uniref:LysM domain-containing protein n=1 Tax=Abeliophyllum distichum TaxID=126358 RepID=A0ABD1NWV2_9LAMI
MELKLSHSSIPTTLKSSILKTSSVFTSKFPLLSQKWKFHIQQISSKGQHITKKISVHVVEKGETLSSISKLYGVPIHEIAALNKDIVDVDLVFEGQRLNVPSSIAGYAHMCLLRNVKWHKVKFSERTQRLGSHSTQLKQIFTVPSFHHLSHAKTTGSFLVLVPLIAFCIRCIMGAYQNRAVRSKRHPAVNVSEMHTRGSNNMRWKVALSDLRDPDTLSAESTPDSDHLAEDPEDPDHLQFEDLSHAYTKLECDYEKFLSECGMSKWGYWRGGSS